MMLAWFCVFVGSAFACDFLQTVCNTVNDKIPVVGDVKQQQSVEFGLSPDDQRLFEHLVGWGLVDSPVCDSSLL